MEEKIKYKGFDIEICTDEYPEDPRKECDNLGTMVCSHKRYSLGDVQLDGYQRGALNLFHVHIDEIFSIVDEFDTSKIVKYIEKNLIILPLFLFDHSGITMNTTGFSCRWDSGQVGFIYVHKGDVRKEYGWKNITISRIKKIEEYLRGEVMTYDNYITGEVYGFMTKDGEEDIDSCCGFYGDEGRRYAISEAKSSIDSEIGRREGAEWKKMFRDEGVRVIGGMLCALP